MSLITVILLLCASLDPAAVGAGDSRTTVRLDTVPPLSEVRPFSAPVKLLLEVFDSSGTPVEGRRLKIRLQAPAPHWLFSTDFPLVEGTLLSEMVAPVSRGRVEWEYVFPIRGTYRLEVESTGSEPGIKEVLRFRIKESQLKLLFLGTFIMTLFLSGFVAGRLFTASRRRAG